MSSYWNNKYPRYVENILLKGHRDGNQSNPVFFAYNRNMKYDFIGVFFTSNLLFKRPVVKTLFSCIKNGFKSVVFNSQPIFDHAVWPSNLNIYIFFEYWSLCLVFLFWSLVCFSSNYPFSFNNLGKQSIFKTNYLIVFLHQQEWNEKHWTMFCILI